MKFLFFLVGFFICIKINSQSLQKDTLMLAEVVVEGSSPLKRINESPFNVVAIDASALHNSAASVSDALDRVSGVKIRETGGLGSHSQINLNGFSGRHVKIFLDGVPMESMGSAFQVNNMPVGFADRIEVYKGVVPVEFGADALGGAINIVSAERRTSNLDASYSFGSFNTHRSNINFRHRANSGFTLIASAYQNYSDNSYRVKTRLLDLTTNSFSTDDRWFRRFHDNYHNETVTAKAGVTGKPWADRLLVGAVYSREKADIQNANLMKIVYGGRERRAQSIIPSMNYEKRFAKNLRLTLLASYNNVKNNNTDTLARQYNWAGAYRDKATRGEGQYSMAEYVNRTANLTANLSYRWRRRHSLTVNNRFDRFTRRATDAAANSETATAATFMRRVNTKNVLGISYLYNIEKCVAVSAFGKYYDVGVRGPVNVSTTTTAAYEEQMRRYQTSGYGIAATVFAARGLQIKTSFERACRLPSETELFGDESLETGDAGLKPETSRNLNLNISYSATFQTFHTLNLDAGIIYRDTRDYIRRRIEQRYGGAFSVNHGQVRNLGIDGEIRYFYRKTFSAGGNFTLQNIRNLERYDIYGRELIYYLDRMPNVPYLLGNADAAYVFHRLPVKHARLSVGYNLRYVHSFFRDWESEGGDIVIPSQLSHDLHLVCSLKDGRYNISFEINNLTDELLYDNYSLQKPGRRFMVMVRYFLQ
jgi:outer membrane cobalamin receptor